MKWDAPRLAVFARRGHRRPCINRVPHFWPPLPEVGFRKYDEREGHMLSGPIPRTKDSHHTLLTKAAFNAAQEPRVSDRSRTTVQPVTLILLCALALLFMSACSSSGSGNKGPQTPIVTFVSPTTGATIDQAQNVSVTVQVSNDPQNQGVTWTLQNALNNQKAPGSLTGTTTTGATYAAEATVTTTQQINIVATSIADPNSSASLSVTIEPPPAIISEVPTPITTCPSAGSIVIPGVGAVASVGAAYSATFTESGGVPPFTWTINGTDNGSVDGLNLQTTTNQTSQATLTGSPSSSGCMPVALTVRDRAGVVSAALNFQLLVVPTPLGPRIPDVFGAYINPNTSAGIPYAPVLLSANGGVPPYSWSVQSGSVPPPGLTLNGGGALSGTPSASGLAQNGGLGAYAFTAIVNDTQTPYPAVGISNLNIGVNDLDSTCHTGGESSVTASAPYAFVLRGFDAGGPYLLAGNFTTDANGNVTGGVEDINRSSATHTGLSITGGTYTVGSDNRGCLSLTTSAGTSNFRIALGGCSTTLNQQSGGCTNSGYFQRGRLIEFDSASSRGSGVIRLQDSSTFSSSGLTGLYAFGLSGWDSSGGRYVVAGSANASAAGTFSSIAGDINDAGTVASSLTGGSGTFSIAATGRGTATVTVGAATFDLALYPVSANEALFASTDPISASHPLLTGRAVTTTGPFSATTLPNIYMLQTTGLTDANLGVLAFDGISTVSGTVYENQAGTVGTASVSANYALDSATGRLTITAPNVGQTVGPHTYVGYAVPNSTGGPAAFLISTDTSADAGSLEFQNINLPPITSFGNANVVGGYFFGTDEPSDKSSASFVGTITASGTGSKAGNEDLNTSFSSLLPNQGFTGSYSVTKTGTGNFGGETVSVTDGSVVYSLDESPLDLHPVITVVEK